MNYPSHPAAQLFPMMTKEEISLLAADIKKNGLIDPIVLYEDQILDGRNRQAACEIAKIEPKFIDANGHAASPVSYVLSRNLHRRHLTISQRGAIAAEAVPLFEIEARKRMNSGTLAPIGATLGKSAEIAAEKLDVSPRTVERALYIKKHHPEVFEQVKRGEITVNEATGEQDRQRLRRKTEAEARPKTERQKISALSCKERMVSALSTVTGICRGFDDFNVEMAISVCTKEEQDLWSNRARELANKIRKFAVRIEGANNADSSQD